MLSKLEDLECSSCPVPGPRWNVLVDVYGSRCAETAACVHSSVVSVKKYF